MTSAVVDDEMLSIGKNDEVESNRLRIDRIVRDAPTDVLCRRAATGVVEEDRISGKHERSSVAIKSDTVEQKGSGEVVDGRSVGIAVEEKRIVRRRRVAAATGGVPVRARRPERIHSFTVPGLVRRSRRATSNNEHEQSR